MTIAPGGSAYHFRLAHGARKIDCVVTDDAIEALGVKKDELSAQHRQFFKGIAEERLEWSRLPQRTITIDAWDIQMRRQE